MGRKPVARSVQPSIQIDLDARVPVHGDTDIAGLTIALARWSQIGGSASPDSAGGPCPLKEQKPMISTSRQCAVLVLEYQA